MQIEIKNPEQELSIANDISGIVSNLADADEAIEYARLYIKAMHEAARETQEQENYDFNEEEVYKIVAEVDARFCEEVSE